MINLLFTSAGRRVELLQAFRQAYQTLSSDGHIICTDIDPLAPAIQGVDRYYLTPRTLDPNFIPTIAEICHTEHITLVFPLIDPDIPVLAAGRQQIEASGAKVVVVPELAARITGDKWETFQFFRKHSIPTPYSWLPHTFNEREFVYPIFIKPRFGSAAKNTFRVNTPDELRFFQIYVEQPLIQEFVGGTEITSDVICDFEGRVLSVVSRQRIEVRWGEVAKAKTVFEPEIAQTCIRIAQALRAIGPITIQCFIQDGVPIFTEINARYGGGAPLGIAAGVPSPEWYLRLASGQKVIPPPLGSYQKGLYLTRYDQSFFLSEQDTIHAQSHHL